jgi:hypothetical protein
MRKAKPENTAAKGLSALAAPRAAAAATGIKELIFLAVSTGNARTHTLYCDLPHLLQNFACAGIVAPHIMQLFVVFLGSSMSTGLNVGSCCCGWGEGSV